MLRSIFTGAAIGFAAIALCSKAWATEADALAISANIQATHVPYGTVIDPIFASPATTQIVGYTRCGDSAIWTGHYLAAEAFRYQVTQDPNALNNVQQALAGIKSLLDVTGTNLLARCLVPLYSQYAAGIASEEAANGIYTNSSAGYIWVGNTSRDQYLGVAFGLGVAWDMVGDQTVRNSITVIASRLIRFLTGNNWSVVMPDGSSSTTFLIRPDQMLALLQIGAHVDSSDFSSEYEIERALLAATVLAPVAVDVLDDSSYFKFNLDYIDLYNLIRMDASAAKSIYQSAYSVLRSATSGDQNGMFDMVDRALNGPNASRDAEAVALISQWLQRPRRDVSVNLTNVVPVCGGQACTPVPVVLRPPDEYLWEETPYQLTGGGSGIIETAGVDYILPYWMARYYGVIGPVEVQSAAAPNGVVAPDSIASIYGSSISGSNLASVTAQATTQPPPMSLGGVTVTVTDSAGVARSAPLMYVSPSQINFVVPDGTAAGTAQFSIQNGTSTITAAALIQPVAPALFSMSGNGTGVAAANAILVTSQDKQLAIPVFQCAASVCDATPISLNVGTVYLVLYGTGIRGASLSSVTANVNGTAVPVVYAGPQSSYAGFDQVNLSLPASLSGSGEVNVVLMVNGQMANVVSVSIQ